MAISTRRAFQLADWLRSGRSRWNTLSSSVTSLSAVTRILIVLHVIKMWSWFSRINFLSGQPIMNVDYAQFYGRALRAHAFLSSAGRFWGYDPFDMAGYVSGPFLEVGVHFISLVAHILSPLIPIGVTLLVLEVLGLALAPVLVVFAVRNVGGTRAQAWSSFALVTLTFGFLDPFSERMIRVGLYGFMVAGFVGILQVSLVWRWLSGGAWRVGAAMCAVTAVLFQIHPASLVVVLVPNVVLFLLLARGLGSKKVLATLGFMVTALAANAYWMRPFIAFSDWQSEAPYFITDGFLAAWRTLEMLGGSLFLGVRITMLTYVFCLAAIAVIVLIRRNRALGIMTAAWLVALFVEGYFGSSFPILRHLQPGRNSFAFWIVASVIAGMAVPGAVMAFPVRRRFAIALYAICASMIFMPLARDGRNFPPLTNRLPEDQVLLIDALNGHRVDGRVLVECIDFLTPHFADLLPFMVPGQAFLGGQHPGNFIKGRFSLFSGAYLKPGGWVPDEPSAFSRPIKTMDTVTLETYFRLYNVQLVAARSPSMRAALVNFPALLGPPRPAGSYLIYPVLKTFGWFETGSGRVTLALDRITIDDASTGNLVLRSHWIKTLRVEPECRIQPVFLADDPVPFISIYNPAGHRRLVVYNAGL